ncbi:PqiC family protein [Salinisphaera aquimarina]|uniref:Membrane integrity-associated transporter subunit PqiC n=1 Tax=Salinisphaera aquimarina TaxID=2094031 RepID=A0ABV7EJB3_9GAMM
MKSVFQGGAIAVCLLGLSACASVPPVQHVLLSPPQSERATTRASRWDVRRVQMPEYLDSYDVQLRTDEYVLTRLPDSKWAERLPVAMTRLLQQTIDEKLVNKRDRPYQVDVKVDTFEPQPSGQVVLSARWTVTDTQDDTVIARDNSLIQQPLPAANRDAAAIGRAMSEAVRQLAFRIVAAAG